MVSLAASSRTIHVQLIRLHRAWFLTSISSRINPSSTIFHHLIQRVLRDCALPFTHVLRRFAFSLIDPVIEPSPELAASDSICQNS
jgi:hypothetical protein